MELFTFVAGTTPLVISVPHAGTHVPPEIARDMTEDALANPDADWHVPLLYDFAQEIGAGMIVATHARTVVDLNRPPDGGVLYPGASNTEVCPTTTFDEKPVHKPRKAPDKGAIGARVARYWRPYHDHLRDTLDGLVERHGIALLFDAHSIRSVVPRFFEGRLPDLNLGTVDGASCATELRDVLAPIVTGAAGFTGVVDGRFKGGHITRGYGEPGMGVHAVQLELSQITYMDEAPPYTYRPELAAKVKPVLRRVVEATLDWGLKAI